MRFIVVFLLLLTSIVANAQQMLGITAIKYSGTHSALLNPSTPVLSPLYLDINLATVNVSVENNFIWMPASENKFRRFLRPEILNGDLQALQDDKFYSDYNTPGNKSGFINLRVVGPSITMMLGRHSFGISTGVRSVTTVKNIPQHLAKFLYEGMYFPDQHNIRYEHTGNMSFATLNWMETGFNYSYIVRARNRNVISAGITIKSLQGYAGAYLYSNYLDYMVMGYDTLIIYKTNLRGGISAPVGYDNNQFNNGLVRGNGIGFDIGFTFEKKTKSSGWLNMYSKPCAQGYTPHIYRAGISLLDIGNINFTSNSIKLNVDNGSLYWPDIRSIGNTTVNKMTGMVSYHFFNDSTQMISDNKFRMWLPAALSMQGDFALRKNMFISGNIILPLTNGNASVVSPALLASGIRFENKYLSIGMIASLYDWQKLHIGVNGRFMNFFIGTENLISFLRLTDYTGTDLYAGIRISLNKGRCRQNTSRCPDFF